MVLPFPTPDSATPSCHWALAALRWALTVFSRRWQNECCRCKRQRWCGGGNRVMFARTQHQQRQWRREMVALGVSLHLYLTIVHAHANLCTIAACCWWRYHFFLFFFFFVRFIAQRAMCPFHMIGAIQSSFCNLLSCSGTLRNYLKAAYALSCDQTQIGNTTRNLALAGDGAANAG